MDVVGIACRDYHPATVVCDDATNVAIQMALDLRSDDSLAFFGREDDVDENFDERLRHGSSSLVP